LKDFGSFFEASWEGKRTEIASINYKSESKTVTKFYTNRKAYQTSLVMPIATSMCISVQVYMDVSKSMLEASQPKELAFVRRLLKYFETPKAMTWRPLKGPRAMS